MLKQICVTGSEVVIETVTGLRMTWDVTQFREPATLLVVDGDYEVAETLLLTHLVARARAFVDVGANIGYYSLTLAQADSSLVVCAIEPASDTRARLVRNIELNRMQTRVSVVATAVGDEPGEALLYKPDATGNVGASLADLHPDELTRTESVSVRLLDEVTESFLGAQRDVLLKMDIEGAEERALRGASKTLGCCFAIVVELSRKWLAEFGSRATDVLSFLAAAGFACFSIEAADNGMPVLRPTATITEATSAVNFLFLHESVSDDIALELRRVGYVIDAIPS